MLALHVVEGLAGGLLVVGTWWSVLITVVVPRGRTSLITAAVYSGVKLPFRMVTRPGGSYEKIDAVLAAQAPVALLGLLLGWLVLFLCGYALLFAGFGADIDEAVREAGSSLLTLGFADPAGPLVVVYAAAATGLTVVALQIGYLPALYSAYNRRETLVTLLAGRAGVPSWGPEVLVRHQLVGITDSLAGLFAQWESFAADVAETHTSYPILVYFRSPRSLRSWLVGLLAVLDAAALYLALAPGRAPSEARLCLRMGYLSLREIAAALGVRVNNDPKPDDPLVLTAEEFGDAVDYIRSSGFAVERDAAAAWPHFRGWRVNYEHAALSLAERIDAPPALWSGFRRTGAAPMPPMRPRDRRPADREGAPPPLPVDTAAENSAGISAGNSAGNSAGRVVPGG
jgi:hypothetical protein